MHVGDRIQQKIVEQRISQNKLAKAAQISQSGLSSIISGAVSPKEVTLAAIANALGCSVSELMGEEQEKKDKEEMIPKTPEAKILSLAVDKLPKAQREMAVNVVRAMFSPQYADLFTKEESDDT